jgi:hypothetical protein
LIKRKNKEIITVLSILTKDNYRPKNQYIMKKYHQILFLIAVGSLTACTSGFQASSTLSAYDDIYYSANDIPRSSARVTEQSNNQYSSPTESNDYVKDDYALEEPIEQNNYTNPAEPEEFRFDDHHDYEYAARLRRFHGPTLGMGMGYYDPFFVDPFFYNRNPAFIGGSIYDPFYNPWGGWNVGIGVGVGFGWGGGFGYNPYNPWGWSTGFGWNNPWGWNNGFGWNNAYWAGYNNGFNNGFFGGNGFDNGFGRPINNIYYGPRGGSISSPYRSGSRAESGPATRGSGSSSKIANPNATNATESLRPTTRPDAGNARPAVRPEQTNTRPASRPNTNQYVRPSEPTANPSIRPNRGETPAMNARPEVPKSATAVPQQNTRPTRTNTYSRPSRSGSYNRSTTPQRTSPTRVSPRSSSPSRSPSFNSSPSFNRSSGGGGSRSSSPRSSSPR